MHRVDVPAATAQVDRAAADQRFGSGWNQQRLNRCLEDTALFDTFPLLNHRFLMEQLNCGCAIDSSLFGDRLIGFDIDHNSLSGTIKFVDDPLQLGFQDMARTAGR